jgi:hypothetical protein
LQPINPKLANGKETLIIGGEKSGFTIHDFWAWAYSDCLNYTSRGVLAEFLVATALGLDIREPRKAWANYDLTYRNRGVEVKSASYHQSWFQESLSRISFSVPSTLSWDDSTNAQAEKPSRDAGAYVLALLAEQNRDRINPLNTDQWQFWVIATTFFNERRRSQTSITLASLHREVGFRVNMATSRRLSIKQLMTLPPEISRAVMRVLR